MSATEPHTTRTAADTKLELAPEHMALVNAMIGRRVRDLHIEVRGGGLILRVRASSFYAKQLAQHAALATLGLPLSANEIEVTDMGREALGRDEEASPRREVSPSLRVIMASGDAGLRMDVHACLAAHGHVFTAAGGVECVALIDKIGPDVLVLDSESLWGGAEGVLDNLQARGGRPVPIVLLDSRTAKSLEGGRQVDPLVVAVIEKPVEMDALIRVVVSAAGRCLSGPECMNGRRGEEVPRAVPDPPKSQRTPRTKRAIRMSVPRALQTCGGSRDD